jgi:hypothetical protein
VSLHVERQRFSNAHYGVPFRRICTITGQQGLVQAGCTLELGVRFRPDSELLAKCLLAGYATSDSDVIAVPIRLQVPGQVMSTC